MKNQPGYPLPTGELGDDEIVCQLVYLPDRPEYWQAFLGALHYMTTWRAWERDDDKRGKDAAANWRAAFEITIGCWRMTCLEQLQDDVAAILAILQVPQPCCDAGDVTDGDQYTDRVEDGVGNVPQNIIDAGYAEDAADWDGFDDYKCMIAHVTVNQIEARLNQIAPLVDVAGGVLGGVAALAAIMAVIVGTGGLAIVFGIVAGVGATSLLYAAITEFGLVESLATKVATYHDELACAIYDGDGDEDALSSLNDKIDELFTTAEALVLTNMNLGPTLKALYAGRYDQQDIADELLDAGYELDDFDCSYIFSEYYQEYVFDYSLLGFVKTNGWHDIRADLTGNLSSWLTAIPKWGYFYRTLAGFIADLGESGPFRTVRVEFDYRFYTHLETNFTTDERLSLYISTDGGFVDLWHKNFGDDGLGEDEWGHVTLTGASLGWWENNDWMGSVPWKFRSYALNAAHGTLCYEINNLKFWLDDGQD